MVRRLHTIFERGECLYLHQKLIWALQHYETHPQKCKILCSDGFWNDLFQVHYEQQPFLQHTSSASSSPCSSTDSDEAHKNKQQPQGGEFFQQLDAYLPPSELIGPCLRESGLMYPSHQAKKGAECAEIAGYTSVIVEAPQQQQQQHYITDHYVH